MPVRELPPVLAEKARVELNEDPKRLNDDIQHLKDWIAKQPHLRARTDDQWLVTFLRGTKYSLERTKEKLDMFYSLKTTAPDMFRIQYDNPKFNEILSLGAAVILPKRESPIDAMRVVLIKLARFDPNKYNLLDVMAVLSTIQRILMVEDDNTAVVGTVSLVDLEGVTMAHLLQMTPAVLKKLTVAGQDASPLRMKGTHIINLHPGIETILNVLRGLLNEKNKTRIHVHNTSNEELYRHIPKEILPSEYGGTAGTIDDITEYWKKVVQDHSAYLEEDKKFGTDESKRPGKPRTAADMFGQEGSFRKLEVD